MKEKKNYVYTVVLIIFLLIQAIFIFLNLFNSSSVQSFIC